ncbi:MAG: hypothetical protein CME65_01435 [Halobacteriovoraceae bacterium]|nr:hypothetical protein [Halobacteriovoraceae bacterium]
MKKETRSKKDYNPNVGFIGQTQVQVANYIFSAKKSRQAYTHAKPIAKRLLKEAVADHYSESKRLTKFLKNRDLTFSKKTSSGEYKTFTVPCTTTVVPLQKSLFNDVEKAAQKLMIALRAVIQDIYGSKSVESSKFVQHLPTGVREIFIEAVKSSPNYFPQLHHKNMKNYPFMDNVGLDLVLVEDYLNRSEEFPNLISRNKLDEIPGLPFRILEINAGSPSGASNNMNVLQGLYEQAPEILDSLGKVMPNDHFKILGETYRSLGEAWTKNKKGVQILLPPGGSNGAAPEIHQLAAYSGLIYAEADQLYHDEQGYIRLRTVAKENPIVTAIYSRVNADSALYDPEAGLFMKDPESAEPVYLRDNLIKDDEDEGKIVLDPKGKPIPMQSAYAIPGIINAIIDRKIYMGGLNRILDNKIILATLTHYAPKYYASKIQAAGLELDGSKIMPPQTLPPTAKSVETIKQNPDEWVIKVPTNAGGQGVYILKTLSKQKREEVLKMIEEKPSEYAYQQLVKIARIPVAVQRKAEGFKFANLAADIRTWVFFGGNKDDLPRMTHNALVRYAPQERGKMSSIVNTSAGGGYAPFVIVDDVEDQNSVYASDLIAPIEPIQIKTDMPVFVAAQMVQIARMLREAKDLLSKDVTYAYELLELSEGMKVQLKEILSFLHPRSIESVYKIIDMLEHRIGKTDLKKHKEFISDSQLTLVSILKQIEDYPEFPIFRDIIDNIRATNTDKIIYNYNQDDKSLDLVIIDDAISFAEKVDDKFMQRKMFETTHLLKQMISKDMPNIVLGLQSKKTIEKHLKTFCNLSIQRLKDCPNMAEYAQLFNLDADVTKLKFETLYLGERDIDKEIKVASQFEMRNQAKLTESDYIGENLKRARQEWKKIEALAQTLKPEKRKSFLEAKREDHFRVFPKLAEFQAIIDKPVHTLDEMIKLLDIAPFAKFNIEKFAEEQGCSVKEVFSHKLEEKKISILNSSQLKRLRLSNREYAGECFAKKLNDHGLYSDSRIYLWVRSELDPFTKLYTIGHELIHFQQLKHSMLAEKRALKDGGLSLAKFLNYYGNFLGANQRTIDKIEFDMQKERKPLYGYADRIHNQDLDKPVICELDAAIRTSDLIWEEKLDEYGSLFGYMMPNSLGIRVKALQEVLPALENAKNILFAKELGLKVDADPVKAALPTANANQINYFREEIIAATKSAKPHWEALRIIASHQYHGVTFFRADVDHKSLTLEPKVRAVAVGSSYNQTQQ